MKKNTYTAIITARGGSKGLPRKNVLNLAGKPMIAHTIIAALESQSFEHVFVTTDSREIKEVSLAWGAEVINRPSSLATDNASSIDALEHALTELKRRELLTSEFCLLQPTSPLRKKEHILAALEHYEYKKATTLASIVEFEDSPFKAIYKNNDGSFSPVRRWDDLTSARQQLPKSYKTNGAIYIGNTNKFLLDKQLLSSESYFYEMNKKDSCDIDTKEDLEIVRGFFK